MSEERHTGREPAASATDPVEREILAELLEAPAELRAPPLPGAPCLVAEVLDDRHPTLQGRVQVRFIDASAHEQALWVPTLQGLAVRTADQVLMVRPGNATEWIVTGVVDGFARRPAAKLPAARLELRSDEALQVLASGGQALLEISQGQAGPVVRILERDVQVAFAGKLAIRAEDIALEATDGEVTIKANKDVVVKGEVVQLN